MGKLLKWTGRLLTLLTALALLGGLVDPRVFWVPSIFSPVLPLLLFACTALLVLLAYKGKWREAIFPLLVILLALPSWRKTIAINLQSRPDYNREVTADSIKQNSVADTSGTLLLITANLATLKSPKDNYPLNEEGVRRVGERLAGADVLFVQEYGYDAADWRTASLQKYGRYPHFLKAREGRLAIFSRAPLTYRQERFKYNVVNGFLVADLEGATGPVRLINLHLRSNRVTGMANTISKEGNLRDNGTWQTLKRMFGRYGRSSALRSEQAEAVMEVVQKSPHPCVVGGDFNDVPTSYAYRILTSQSPLQDSWRVAGNGLGKTFAGALPGLRIDYVLADTSMQVLSIQKLDNGHSDHHPLKVELRQ